MFRATAKKRKKTITRLRSDSDDDEEETKKQEGSKVNTNTNNNEEEEESPVTKPSIKFKKKKKDKKKGLVVRSFDVGEDEDDEEEGAFSNIVSSSKSDKKKKKHRKRKRGGLGFGGSGMAGDGGDDKEEEDDKEQDAIGVDKKNNGGEDTAGKSKSLLYDKGAMEKLKQAQSYKAKTVVEDATMEEVQGTIGGNTPKANNQEDSANDRQQSSAPNLGEYIPLNNNSSSNKDDNNHNDMILTGEDALKFQDRTRTDQEKRSDDHFNSVTQDATFLDDAEDQQEADEASAWEEQIARRAGIHNNNKNSADSSSRGRTSNANANATTSSSAVSLSKLRSQIQSTISQLETQDKDVSRACERRRVELKQTETELQRQEKELEESGKAVDDYQQLREELTFWTGALRDLKSKVEPIQEAFIDLDADVAGTVEWQNWEDDMCAILHQAGLLDRVMGRQPPDAVFEDKTAIVDEFGRDVKSQHAMSRDKRTRRRLEMQAQRKQPVNEDDSDAFVYEDEINSLHQRRSALTEALQVAVGDLEDDYTQLPKLAAIFQRWHNSYPEDFKQSFAYLSMGDLASVLIEVDLCKACASTTSTKGWLDGLSNHDGTQDNDAIFSWISKLAPNNEDSKQLPVNDISDRIIEKCFIPVLTNILDKSSFNLTSKKQSSSFSALFARLKSVKSKGLHPGLGKLETRIADYITTSLNSVAIAILNNSSMDIAAIGDDADEIGRQKRAELQDALRGATTGQLLRLSKMASNVLTHWSPHLQSQADGGLENFLLDFLSSKYLFLLSSLRGRSECTSQAFSQVWTGLKETKWLDQPSRMLQAAPLRAAAVAFNLQ